MTFVAPPSWDIARVEGEDRDLHHCGLVVLQTPAPGGGVVALCAADCSYEEHVAPARSALALEHAPVSAGDWLRQADQRLRVHGSACFVSATACCLAPGGVLSLAHVGETRAYVVAAASVTQITHDHTSPFPSAEAGAPPILVNALGCATHVDEVRVTLGTGDKLVLATPEAYACSAFAAWLQGLRSHSAPAVRAMDRLPALQVSRGAVALAIAR